MPDAVHGLDQRILVNTKKRTLFQEDDSPTPSPTKAFPAQNMSASKTASPNKTENQIDHAASREANSESDESSEDEIRRPVGRAARRMLGGIGRRPATELERHSEPSANAGAAEAVDQVSGASDNELYTSTPPKKHQVSSPPGSIARSSLFVSPAKSQDESEDELMYKPFDSKSRLAELVAEKRAERLAREANENEGQSAHQPDASSDLPDELVEHSQDPVNRDIERIMSDAAKPTRKASKKAMQEMERETQRLSRQQALAHQMKVKKKFSTSDLFARFNYRPAGETVISANAEGDTTASSAPNSDAVEAGVHEPASTPPSSPPTPLDRQAALVDKGALSKLIPVREDSLASLGDLNGDEAFQNHSDLLSTSRKAETTTDNPIEGIAGEAQPQRKGLKLARLGKKAVRPQDDDSDDELEILKNLPSHLSVFDRAKGLQRRENTDSTAIHTLKHLSHIGADYPTTGKRKKGSARPSVNPQALEVQLRLRAKEQARAQQLERIAELKAKGIEVQTSEEREREQEEFENLLEKARQDAVELRKAEKAAAKENGEKAASDDETEDEDYVDESGSEEEQREANKLVDDAADESDEEEELDEYAAEDEEGDELQANMEEDAQVQEDPAVGPLERPASPAIFQTPSIGRKPRRLRIIQDDDDSDGEPAKQSSDARSNGAVSHASKDDPFAAFGFGAVNPGSSLISPTQAFKATMQTPTQATQEESQDLLRRLVPPMSSSLPPISPVEGIQTQGDSQVSFIPGSQVPDSQQINLAWETQAPETPLPALNRGSSHLSIETPGWEPTQDAGLLDTTPAMRRENALEPAEESNETQSTVPLRISQSPEPSRNANRRRLIRGPRANADSSDEEATEVPAFSKPAEKDAFREMARKRKEKLTAAELAEAEREAKQMMDEQAEESEDEYAGLGGDDFVAPETEQDREMIDSSHVDVNERELAAHFAERQRVADEAAANKLYKDLMTGGLRRKQANMFDLDDDEDDLAVRRRQMKQREEARKRKLLLQDDNIAGLAEGKHSKGKDAFLKAIADDDERDDDVLDLSEPDEEDSAATQADSQPSQQNDDLNGPLQEVSGNKRRMDEEPHDRLPAKQRRTRASAFRAPTSLLEVKESVSFLLDEPHTAPVGPSVLDVSSESEKDEAEADQDHSDGEEGAMQEELDRQNDGGFAPDRIAMPPPRLPASQRRTAPRPAVVDRLSLKRGSSASDSSHSRTAWAASSNGAFKPPSLLRRATTNTTLGANERGVSTSGGLSRENSASVKMGGTKKSSLAYQARAEERKAIVEASTRKRQENTARIAQLRRAASSNGFGKGLGGRFE